jgi:hypothetical protein
VSVEEFLAQAGETYHDFHELWNAQIVEVPAPSEQHMLLQEQIALDAV